MKKPSFSTLLRSLARTFGIQSSYLDVGKVRRKASLESLQRILAALGVSVGSAAEAEETLDAKRRESQERVCDPVLIAWNGSCRAIKFRLPGSGGTHSVRGALQLEGGETLDMTRTGENHDCILQLPPKLPLGYHKLHVEYDGTRITSTLISAPRKAFLAKGRKLSREWGVVTPVYSLRSNRNWGSGDLADLAEVGSWLKAWNGRVVGTLPLMAVHLQEPFDPSPYAPLSRRAWNEFYLAIDQLPELRECAPAAELVNSAVFQQELQALRDAPLVDYRQQSSLRRRVLELLSQHFFHQRGSRWNAFQQAIHDDPFLEDYARFRAVWECNSKPWQEWSERQRAGQLDSADFDQAAFWYHLFAQWATRVQVEKLSSDMHLDKSTLYLDYPVGVHPNGYDAWRHADLFVPAVAVGAPPDAVFTKGQNWGLSPLHPERLRATGYRYFIESVRCQMQQAGAFRIDHVMGLHRQFWVPAERPASEGVFVNYPAEEMYAVLCLESHRQQTQLMGENLGTVPPAVNRMLNRHGISGTYVVQYELKPQADEPLASPPALSVASINTHDMPTFAAFLQGLDLEDLFQLGLFDEQGIAVERARRTAIVNALVQHLRQSRLLADQDSEPSSERIRDALLLWLARSDSRNLLIALEDLWLELLPQNVPGTSTDRPNWRRKHRLTLGAMYENAETDALLQQVQEARVGLRAKTPDSAIAADHTPLLSLAEDRP